MSWPEISLKYVPLDATAAVLVLRHRSVVAEGHGGNPSSTRKGSRQAPRSQARSGKGLRCLPSRSAIM